MVLGFIFNLYVDRKVKIDKGEKHSNNLFYTILKFIRKKFSISLTMLLLGMGLYLGWEFIGYLYIKQDKNWSMIWLIIFGMMRSFI